MSREGVLCRVTQASYRKTARMQQIPEHYPVGKEVMVTMPLGEGELEDWEIWLAPVDPADAPGFETQAAKIPAPGSIADSIGTTDPTKMSRDEQRALLVVEAIEALNPESEEGWNREGYATIKHVQEYIANKLGSGPPRWVNAVLIKSITDEGGG